MGSCIKKCCVIIDYEYEIFPLDPPPQWRQRSFASKDFRHSTNLESNGRSFPERNRRGSEQMSRVPLGRRLDERSGQLGVSQLYKEAWHSSMNRVPFHGTVGGQHTPTVSLPKMGSSIHILPRTDENEELMYVQRRYVLRTLARSSESGSATETESVQSEKIKINCSHSSSKTPLPKPQQSQFSAAPPSYVAGEKMLSQLYRNGGAVPFPTVTKQIWPSRENLDALRNSNKSPNELRADGQGQKVRLIREIRTKLRKKSPGMSEAKEVSTETRVLPAGTILPARTTRRKSSARKTPTVQS